MNTAFTICWNSPLGVMEIRSNGEAITAVSIGKGELEDTIDDFSAFPKVIAHCISELEAYFRGELIRFTVPLAPEGTEFRKKVWSALCEIPYGTTCSYGELAVQMGNPRACRAVGGANNHNPILIIIPCHRVIGADGSLIGYAAGLPVKEWLLRHEGVAL